MKKTNIIMILFLLLTLLFLLLTSCAISVNDKNNITTKVTNSNQRYETGGVSFLPPAGGGWKITRYKPTGSLTFTKSFNSGYAVGYGTVKILPFTGGYSSNDFNENLRLFTKSVKKFNSLYKDSGPYEKINVVRKAGMRCIRKEHSSTTSLTASYNESYTCERQPNQPQDVPLIQIRSSFRNSDEILEPIWKSIQFTPIDRNSKVYLDWRQR